MTKRVRLRLERVRMSPKAAKQAKTAPRAKKQGLRAKLPHENGPESTDGDYAIGRGKPPKHTQFAKGDGRKRPGRKKGSKNLRTIIMEAVNDPVTVNIEGKKRKISKLQATAMQLATKAATGNDRAIAKLLDWVAEIESTRCCGTSKRISTIGSGPHNNSRGTWPTLAIQKARRVMTPSPAKMVSDILRNDFCAFINRSFIELNPDTTLLHNWHLEVVAQKLEEVLHGTCTRLIINLPPRHLKSHSASIAFPAWALGHFPSLQILCVSYGQDLADNLARASRKLITSPFYQATFDTRISKMRDTVADFETTKGGSRFSTSVGGVLTGRGADIIVLDDPLKSDDALSETKRTSVNEWYDNTLRSRLNSQERGSIVIIMQRLHADDLVAHVQESDDWDVVSFPRDS
jgi:hypothetical protein